MIRSVTRSVSLLLLLFGQTPASGEDLDLLFTRLADPSVDVRRAAAADLLHRAERTLPRVGAALPAHLDSIRAALHDPDEGIRKSVLGVVVSAVWGLDSGVRRQLQPLMPTILEILDDQQGDNMELCLWILAAADPPRGSAALGTLDRSWSRATKADHKIALLRIYGNLAPDEESAVRRIAAALQLDNNPSVRLAALMIVQNLATRGTLSPEPTLEGALVAALTDSDRQLRQRSIGAVVALQLRSPAVRLALGHTASDPTLPQDIREEAVRALQALEP